MGVQLAFVVPAVAVLSAVFANLPPVEKQFLFDAAASQVLLTVVLTSRPLQFAKFLESDCFSVVKAAVNAETPKRAIEAKDNFFIFKVLMLINLCFSLDQRLFDSFSLGKVKLVMRLPVKGK